MGKSVVVGSRKYDSVTGLPLSDTDGTHVSHISRRTLRATQRLSTRKSSITHELRPAGTVHSAAKRSTTLNRAYIKKPATALAKPISDMKPATAAPAVAPVTALSPAVARRRTRRIDGMVAPKKSLMRSTSDQAVEKPAAVSIAPQPVDEPAKRHPIVQKVHAKQALNRHEAVRAKQASTTPPASVIQQAVVNEALQNAPKHHAKQFKLGMKLRTKIISAAFGCLALIMMGGYLTYLNAPNISVRVAAAQAGIDASYPGYHPDGYSLHGPVAFNSGEVSMTFVANANKEVSYHLEQSRSNWDSQALLENYVKGQSGGDYNTSQIKGMTIYSYNGNAAWVSGGILYTISGNASLSPDQVRKIATSLS